MHAIPEKEKNSAAEERNNNNHAGAPINNYYYLLIAYLVWKISFCTGKIMVQKMQCNKTRIFLLFSMNLLQDIGVVHLFVTSKRLLRFGRANNESRIWFLSFTISMRSLGLNAA
jgi:hypothetical protein